MSSVLGKRGYPARSFYILQQVCREGVERRATGGAVPPHGVGVLVIIPGLTQTNFSQNMLERSACLSLDHLRGMTPATVADATLRAIQNDKAEITLTFRGKLLVLVNRLAPWVFELFARKKIRRLFADEIAAREKVKAG